jgi:hypothetical protein
VAIRISCFQYRLNGSVPREKNLGTADLKCFFREPLPESGIHNCPGPFRPFLLDKIFVGQHNQDRLNASRWLEITPFY